MGLPAAKQRTALRQRIDTESFDLTVIGGGITGAGIALDAASRGLSVALVEMKDFASGTSSKSTKLIHGGLRYLKQFEIQLVREVGRERAIVHRLAPHLVTSEKMLLPITEDGTYGKIGTSVGLKVYDFLADVEGDDRRQMLDKEETLAKEPLLRADDLTGGGYYAEYRTDDARLTIEIIKRAAEYGAVSLNYVRADGFSYGADGKITGVQCVDLLDDTRFEINSTYVVSAAGPWVDTLRKKDESLEGKRLFLSKGVHIVVPHDRLPLKNAVYFDVPDGRMMFAIPRNRVTYIGTTDTPYKGDMDDIPAYREDVTYILDGANQAFPTANLTVEDVESHWAGLRPLIYEEGKSASEMSRKDEIFESPTGLISIAGGKLTGYRKMAERIVDLVGERFEREHDRRVGETKTTEIPLTAAPFHNPEEVDAYLAELTGEMAKLNLPDFYPRYLLSNYGKVASQIVAQTEQYIDRGSEIALALAELDYCLAEELVFTPMDFYNRRTGRLYFAVTTIAPTRDAVVQHMSDYFGWDTAARQQFEDELAENLYRAGNFAPAPADVVTA